MASFFDDTFDAVFKQQATPQQTIIPTADLLSQSYGLATAQAPNVIAYNQALAPGLTNVQLGVEKQYDPNAAALRAATSQSILDELNLGTSLGAELQEQVIRNALEGNAASGFGVGVGGRGLVARDLGLTGMDLARTRRNEASGAVSRQTPLANLYRPNTGFAPQELAADIRGVQAAQDEYANLKEDIRRQNFSALLSTGTRIAGTVIGGVVGAYTGNPAGGAQAGGAIGEQVIGGSSVRGVQRQQAQSSGGGGGMSSIFSMMGGMGGGGGGGGGGVSAGLGGGIYS